VIHRIRYTYQRTKPVAEAKEYALVDAKVPVESKVPVSAPVRPN